jgi:predicted dehydrogenase
MKIAIAGSGKLVEMYTSLLGDMDEVRVAGLWTPETDAEAVCICSSSLQRESCGFEAARQGKHVIVMEPFAAVSEDMERLATVCQEHQVLLFPVNHTRFSAHLADLHREIAEGAIGTLGVAHMNTRLSVDSDDDIELQLIHDLDFVRSSLGEIRSVFAMRGDGESGCLSVTLRLQHGAIVNVFIRQNYSGDPGQIIELAGNQGVIRYNSHKTHSFVIQTNSQSLPVLPDSAFLRSTSAKSYRLAINHCLDCIRNGAKPLIGMEDVLANLKLASEVRKSAETGLPVRLGN